MYYGTDDADDYSQFLSGLQSLQEKRFTKTVDEFINSEFGSRGYTVIYQKLNYNSNPKKVDIAFLNKKLTLTEIQLYNRMLAERGLKNTVINFRQDDANKYNQLTGNMQGFWHVKKF